MRLNILTISCLLAHATASTRIQRRWLNGDAATGTTDPDVTDNCEFWANDISSTDTCAELESYFDASITELHAWNPSLLEDYCVLIEGWSYCVEGPAVTTTAAVATGTAVQVVSFYEVSDFVTSTTAASTPSSSGTATTTTVTATYSGGIPSPTQSGLTTSCTKYYYVENGDTCYTIQDLYLDFTLDEFYSWNPSISSGCVGLEIGYYVCVDAGVSTSATATASTSTSPYEPQQTGIVSTCDDYYYVNEGDSCSEILEDYDITLAEFYSWNPSVGSTCSGMAYGYYVCVGIPGVPTQTGISSDCVTYYEAVSGDSCWSIVTNDYPYLTEAEFIDMNPAVGSDCSDLWVGYDYCVATTSIEPMPGIISTCDSYYLVESGDSCYSIEQAYSITAAEFVEWNPDVGSSCASLWEDYYVCVGVSS
ncbi:LysM domain protein [Penicillium malachiteum]|nr:LysM domain protein [Penicillium malachiteum]